jgi:hypothetical protein
MKAVLITATVLLLVGVAANSHFAGRDARAADESSVAVAAIPPVDIPSNLAQPDEVGPDFKLVLLALLPHGFETNEMHLDAGDYMFIIGNRTGLKEVNVRLDREGRDRVGEALVGGRQRDWKQRFKLTPGNYIVSADNNPDWNCRIVVRP